MVNENQEQSKPQGELALQTLAMPRDTNANGDIFGGWLVGQMDLAASIVTKQVTHGRSATVAIKDVAFIHPVQVGSVVSCYADVIKIGRTSMHISVEVWTANNRDNLGREKAASGLFVFVALDEQGRPTVIEK